MSRGLSLIVFFLSVISGFSTVHAENRINELETDSIQLISTTPVPGLGTDVRKIPGNVQSVDNETLSEQNSMNAAEFIERNLNSVSVTHAQNNPFMPDLMYRGQMASPLLGNPNGLAVFMDGTKMNEPFGDTLKWDFIPQNAISKISIIPGSNAVYGLNALGGVLSLTTKSGFQNPGSTFSSYGGSWSRQNYEFSYGMSKDNKDFFFAGTLFDEDGFRDSSDSNVKQLFFKFGQETELMDYDISLTWADSLLNGTQALPVSFLGNREQAYTYPDTNENELAFLNMTWRRFTEKNNLLSGVAYYREYENENMNSNVNDDFIGTSGLSNTTGLGGARCYEEDELDLDGDGDIDAADETLFEDAGGDDAECPGANEGSTTKTTSYGASLQWTGLFSRHVLNIGSALDIGQSNFSNEEESAVFSSGALRTTTSTGEGFENEVQADADNQYFGLYVSDMYDVTNQISVLSSLRWNQAKINIADGSGANPALNGKHTFERFNPAVGVNYNPKPGYTTFVQYSEGMRAPTPIELTCADPDAPCKLPNAFLADPPLDMIVAKTIEWGARGYGRNYVWNFAIYNTTLEDDIQFINAAGSTIGNAGFFDNVGETQRQGFEVGMGWELGDFGFRADYSYLDATFESTFDINSPNNSSHRTVNGLEVITVNPGNKMPNIPEQTLKARFEYTAFGTWKTGITANYFSDVYARGDENNQDRNGTIDGYTVVNLDSTYKASKSIEIFLKITNLFDENFESFGILGENFFRNTGQFEAATRASEKFVGVGAPIGAFIGIKYNFGS